MPFRIIKQISNQYTVDVDGQKVVCTARGKFRNMRLSPCVGDIVDINYDDKIIEEILPRKNILQRPVVANVDVALIVTSLKKPDLSLSLLDKQLAIIKYHKITPIICFTKLDLLDKLEKKNLQKIIKYYQKNGFSVCFNTNLGKIKRLLKNKVVVLTGQTGAGKSSLLNRLDKKLNIETKPISEALNRGVHTTRHTEIYPIKHIYFVDTPGFSALDFQDMSITDLIETFNEFSNYSCQFPDCTHQKEKDCGVKKALEEGKILASRYDNYLRFVKEINENSSKLFK